MGFISLIIVMLFIFSADCLKDCGDTTWQHMDEKCFKFIENRFVNRSTAEIVCSEQKHIYENNVPKLVEIKSDDEQQFIVNYLFIELGVKDNVWLSAQRGYGNDSDKFYWNTTDPSSQFNYTNWQTGGPSNQINRGCVVLLSGLSRNNDIYKNVPFNMHYSTIQTYSVPNKNPDVGLWRDVSCASNHAIVCQKATTNATTPTPTSTSTQSSTSTSATPSTVSAPIPSTKPTSMTSTLNPIQPTIICNADGEYDNTTEIAIWPPVEAGQYSMANCPSGSGIAKWLCLESGHFDGDQPDLSDCWISDINDIIDNIQDVEEVQDILNNITTGSANQSSITTGQGLIDVIGILEKLQTFVTTNLTAIELNKANSLTNSFINTLNNLIDQNKAWNSVSENNKTIISSQILLNIQTSSFILSCSLDTDNTIKRINTNNVIIETYFNPNRNLIEFQVEANSISIPEALDIEHKNRCNISSVASLTDRINKYLLGGIDGKKMINTKVVGFSLTNDNKTNPIKDGKKVKVRLGHDEELAFEDEVTCVYWDFESQKWSSNGCLKSKESDRYHTVCECDHLTNFAALLDPSQRNDKISSILTDICCGISIVFLLLTIVLLFAPKHNRIALREKLKDRRNLNTLNLCFSLILADVLVVFAMDQIDIKSNWICRLFAALLLYSLLSSFVWMLIEGLHIYRLIVDVFKPPIKIRYNLMLGYGLPIIIIGFSYLIILFTDTNQLFDINPNQYYFCWISSENHPSHIWVFMGPVIAVIMINTYILIILIKKMIGINFIKEKSSQLKKKSNQIISFCFLSTNLGITWFLFVFYIQKWSTVFTYISYVSIVLNGLQGFFIFCYQLILYKNKKTKYQLKDSTEVRVTGSSIVRKFTIE